MEEYNKHRKKNASRKSSEKCKRYLAKQVVSRSEEELETLLRIKHVVNKVLVGCFGLVFGVLSGLAGSHMEGFIELLLKSNQILKLPDEMSLLPFFIPSTPNLNLSS
ncbi:unnamed protein product [Dovyalis caffra]|uniref:Uncharacterized protein n=1 Tax=Dovyalis caffra TaxID=77055 RepID=A0AAV1QU75_9ROSI|nr:unnamed protein product [Dovyalis caffra]